MNKSKENYKVARTIKPYSVKAFGYDLIVPVGSVVSNRTAKGHDDNYRFWVDWQLYVKKLTGFNNSMLSRDLTYIGLNIPEEYCNPWEELSGTST